MQYDGESEGSHREWGEWRGRRVQCLAHDLWTAAPRTNGKQRRLFDLYSHDLTQDTQPSFRHVICGWRTNRDGESKTTFAVPRQEERPLSSHEPGCMTRVTGLASN